MPRLIRLELSSFMKMDPDRVFRFIWRELQYILPPEDFGPVVDFDISPAGLIVKTWQGNYRLPGSQ